jgi:hypothetical protein
MGILGRLGSQELRKTRYLQLVGETMNKLKNYTVTIPIAGAIHVEVEASSASEAKEKAWDRINEKGEDAGDVEWEFFDSITEGNISHAPYNEVEVNRYDK